MARYRQELHAIEQAEHELVRQLKVEHAYYTAQVNTMWAQMEEMYAQHARFESDLQECRVKSEMEKTQIKALIFKHRQWLYSLVTDALSKGWNTWSAQATELQIFWTDHDNRQKEGRRYFKLDKSRVLMLRKDLTEQIASLI